MSHRPSELLSSLDRRLWRDLGFADPEPALLRMLPMLVVAWSDGKLGSAEENLIRDRARPLPAHLREWVHQRLAFPPGPYFRCQVSHLLAFMAATWSADQDRDGLRDWTETGERWASEIIADQGLFRRLFGGLQRERADLSALNEAMHEHGIYVSDRIWALARGAHAEAEPERIVVTHNEEIGVHQALGLTFAGEGQHLAVGTMLALTRDEDLDTRAVEALLGQSRHLRENERWVLLGNEFFNNARPLTDMQRTALAAEMQKRCGGAFEACTFAELSYLEDALARDARWVSWVSGQVEELRVDRETVVRAQIPGTFSAPRARVKAQVAPALVAGPPGLGFRVLDIDAPGANLRLATPAIEREPATRETVQWISRFLPAMCDPWTQLVLDVEGPRWVAEVLPEMATAPSATREPLMPGRALLVPPWVWFRAAEALGVRGPQKQNGG